MCISFHFNKFSNSGVFFFLFPSSFLLLHPSPLLPFLPTLPLSYSSSSFSSSFSFLFSSSFFFLLLLLLLLLLFFLLVFVPERSVHDSECRYRLMCQVMEWLGKVVGPLGKGAPTPREEVNPWTWVPGGSPSGFISEPHFLFTLCFLNIASQPPVPVVTTFSPHWADLSGTANQNKPFLP